MYKEDISLSKQRVSVGNYQLTLGVVRLCTCQITGLRKSDTSERSSRDRSIASKKIKRRHNSNHGIDDGSGVKDIPPERMQRPTVWWRRDNHHAAKVGGGGGGDRGRRRSLRQNSGV